MKTIQILTVGGNAADTADLESMLDGEPGWYRTAVYSDEAAVEQSCARTFDVVITGKDMDAQAVRKLKAVFLTHAADIIFLTQQHNDADALKAEIKSSLEAKRMERLQHIEVRDTLDVKNLADGIRLVNAE